MLIVRVDATTNPQLCAEYGVDGYPQMFWRVYSRITPYRGGMNARNILDFIAAQTQPAAVEIAKPLFNMTLHDTILRMIRQHTRRGVPVALGIFERPNVRNRGRDLNAFLEATNNEQDLHAVYVLVDSLNNKKVRSSRTRKEKKESGKHDGDGGNVSDEEKKEAAKSLGLARLPGVRLFKQQRFPAANADAGAKADDAAAATSFRGRLTAKGIRDFVQQETTPSVLIFSAETAKEIFDGRTGKHEHVVFVGFDVGGGGARASASAAAAATAAARTTDDDGVVTTISTVTVTARQQRQQQQQQQQQRRQNLINTLATRHQDRLNYVQVPAASTRFLVHFGIDPADLPLIAIIDFRRPDGESAASASASASASAQRRVSQIIHRFNGDWTLEHVQQFVDDYVDGSLLVPADTDA